MKWNQGEFQQTVENKLQTAQTEELISNRNRINYVV
jgi:hypothetical protein